MWIVVLLNVVCVCVYIVFKVCVLLCLIVFNFLVMSVWLRVSSVERSVLFFWLKVFCKLVKICIVFFDVVKLYMMMCILLLILYVLMFTFSSSNVSVTMRSFSYAYVWFIVLYLFGVCIVFFWYVNFILFFSLRFNLYVMLKYCVMRM